MKRETCWVCKGMVGMVRAYMQNPDRPGSGRPVHPGCYALGVFRTRLPQATCEHRIEVVDTTICPGGPVVTLAKCQVCNATVALAVAGA